MGLSSSERTNIPISAVFIAYRLLWRKQRFVAINSGHRDSSLKLSGVYTHSRATHRFYANDEAPRRKLHLPGEIHFPINAAGSKGRRNTCAQFTRGGLKAQRFSRTLI